MKRSSADLLHEATNEARKQRGPTAIVLRLEGESEFYSLHLVGYRQADEDETWRDFDLKKLVRSGGEPIGIVGFSETPDQRGMHFYSKPFAEYSEDQKARYYLEQASKDLQANIEKMKRFVALGKIRPDLN